MFDRCVTVAMVTCKQTEDQASLMKWVKAIQMCNEEGHAQKVGVALMGVAVYCDHISIGRPWCSNSSDHQKEGQTDEGVCLCQKFANVSIWLCHVVRRHHPWYVKQVCHHQLLAEGRIRQQGRPQEKEEEGCHCLNWSRTRYDFIVHVTAVVSNGAISCTK